jgi:hypothetical protein
MQATFAEAATYNTSGQGASAPVPAEIQGWNWGAFFLNWIWGLGNNTPLALLMFVPFVNLAMPFVLGAKGSAWAWRNRRWESIDRFKAVQRQWALGGLVAWATGAAGCVALIFAIGAVIKDSEVFKLALQRLEANPEASEFLGRPLTTGMPAGSIEVSGPSGSASMSFSVSGPKGTGTVYYDAKKDMGQWQFERIVFEEQGSGRRIDLAP